MSFKPLIIMVAPNGSHATKSDNPAVPYTVQETVDEIVHAAEAGAAIAHIHARTLTGTPTQNVDVFGQIVDGVRQRSDILIEISLGSGGFSTTEAMAPLKLGPALASFPMEARNEKGDKFAAMEGVVRQMRECAVHPFFGINSLESHLLILDIVKQGLAGAVPCITVSADPFENVEEAKQHLHERTVDLAPNAQWFAIKGGKAGHNQLALRTAAINMGGNVRVGFEDFVSTYDEQRLAPSNAWFVERMVELANTIGRQVATPAEAKRILMLN
jgi:3-keto-5-aminohexanoate cleavage enzyme